MKKQEFITKLEEKLCRLPKKEVDERLNFYSEIIEDKIEDGLTEEQAVADIGSIDEVVNQIIAEIPLSKIVKEKVKSKGKMSGLTITLLCVGFPVWFPLLISAIAVAFSLYVVLWSLVISAFAVKISLCAGVIYGIVCGIHYAIIDKAISGLAFIGCAIILIGLTIFAYYLCKLAVKGTLKLTKKILLGIKKGLINKGEV